MTVTFLPWITFASLYFGSPLPHSLAAKQIIHAYPPHLALARYLAWFFALREPAGMAFVSAASLAGAIIIIFQSRQGLALALWPAFFFLGLSLTRVGPFFWYKVPVLPLYFFLAGAGLESLHSVWHARSRQRLAGAVLILPVAFIVTQLGMVADLIADQAKLRQQVEKEAILAAQARLIADRTREKGKDLAEVRVYAGEVGVVGYELREAYILDSAGIVSPEALAARREDWERLRAFRPEADWRERWTGTPAWSRELIAHFRPDYIISNEAYLHLLVLSGEPEFQDHYRLLDSRADHDHNRFVLYERKD
jgi:hypothetical protein